MRRAIWGLVLGCVLSGAAWADGLRAFPADTMVAQLRAFDGSAAVLDDPRPKLKLLLSTLGLVGTTSDGSNPTIVTRKVTLPVAPGLQIRDTQNLLVMPATLDTTAMPTVRVQLDANGAIWHLWLLTAEEIPQF